MENKKKIEKTEEFKNLSKSIKLIGGKEEFNNLLNEIFSNLEKKKELEKILENQIKAINNIVPIRVQYKNYFSVIENLKKEEEKKKKLEKELEEYLEIKNIFYNQKILSKCLKSINLGNLNLEELKKALEKEEIRTSLKNCLKNIPLNEKNIEDLEYPPLNSEILSDNIPFLKKQKILRTTIIDISDSIITKLFMTIIIFIVSYSLLYNILGSNISPYYNLIKTFFYKPAIEENINNKLNIDTNLPPYEINNQMINSYNMNNNFDKITAVFMFIVDFIIFFLTLKFLERKFLYGKLEKDFSPYLKNYTIISIIITLYTFIIYLQELETADYLINELVMKVLKAIISIADKIIILFL